MPHQNDKLTHSCFVRIKLRKKTRPLKLKVFSLADISLDEKANAKVFIEHEFELAQALALVKKEKALIEIKQRTVERKNALLEKQKRKECAYNLKCAFDEVRDDLKEQFFQDEKKRERDEGWVTYRSQWEDRYLTRAIRVANHFSELALLYKMEDDLLLAGISARDKQIESEDLRIFDNISLVSFYPKKQSSFFEEEE